MIRHLFVVPCTTQGPELALGPALRRPIKKNGWPSRGKNTGEDNSKDTRWRFALRRCTLYIEIKNRTAPRQQSMWTMQTDPRTSLYTARIRRSSLRKQNTAIDQSSVHEPTRCQRHRRTKSCEHTSWAKHSRSSGCRRVRSAAFCTRDVCRDEVRPRQTALKLLVLGEAGARDHPAQRHWLVPGTDEVTFFDPTPSNVDAIEGRRRF